MTDSLVPQMMGMDFFGGHGPMMGPFGFGGASMFGLFSGFLLPLVVLLGFLVLLVLLVLAFFIRRALRRSGSNIRTTFNRVSQDRPGARQATSPSPGVRAEGTGREAEAMRILAARLAAGDISPEDYQTRVNTLRTVRDEGLDPTAGLPHPGQR